MNAVDHNNVVIFDDRGIDINTMCRQTDAADRFRKPIYEQDILLYETAEEIGYFIVQDLETTVDIVNGEIIEVGDLDTENIKNIGNMVDYSDFVCLKCRRSLSLLSSAMSKHSTHRRLM